MKGNVSWPLEWSRREWLARVGTGTLGGILGVACRRDPGLWEQTPRPHIFLSQDPMPGNRSIAELRLSIREGLPRASWERIRTLCHEEFEQAVLTPRSPLPDRPAVFAEQNNPDYTICAASGQRIIRHALAMHMEEDPRYLRTSLAQLEAIIDESVWPDWIDQAHMRFGHRADLRTGMLSQDIALAFDWLYPFLSDTERSRILEGLERRGIRPYLESMEQDPWWAHDLNNWYTVIIGGLGIAGMALGDAHPLAQQLFDLSFDRMQAYLSIYGAGGEFNESISYANSTRIPVAYFQAYACHRRGRIQPLTKRPFPQIGEWTQYLTLPPGRYAAFGDGWVGAPPMVGFLASIATATRDPVLQGFVERHLQASSDPWNLIWFDPTLKGVGPEGRLPLGRVFEENGAQMVSRSDWDPDAPVMIVYGKAKRDHNHDHNDVGQVCIDARGERLIVDPGSPSGYPVDFFEAERWEYYNASIRGHNVLMFGGREQRSPSHERGVKESLDWKAMNGEILRSEFDEKRGGFWQMDLTRAYDGAVSVRRTVIHLFPGYAAVLDEAELEAEEPISLRWHTINAPELSDAGTFLVKGDQVGLSARVIGLTDDALSMKVRRHAYTPPFDRDRAGMPLEARREPYVEVALTARKCRLLTLFATSELSESSAWVEGPGGWTIETPEGLVRAELDEHRLILRHDRSDSAITVTL